MYAVGSVSSIDSVKPILKVTPQCGPFARIIDDSCALRHLVETCCNLVSTARQRSISCVSAVGPIGQKAPVFAVKNEENSIEEKQTLFLTELESVLSIERVRRVCDEPFDRKPLRFKNTISRSPRATLSDTSASCVLNADCSL